MDQPVLTPKRIKIAFVIAVFADALEFPIAWIESFDSEFLILSGKFMGVVLDCCVMAAMTWLLGLHWVFFPSFCIEAVPKVDMFPTWVAAVAYVVWQDKKNKERQAQGQPQSQTLPPIIDVEVVNTARKAVSAVRGLIAPPPQPPPRAATEILAQSATLNEPPVEQRLKRLNDLRDKNLISESEYETKRQQILAEI